MLGAKPLFINNSALGGLPPARTSIRLPACYPDLTCSTASRPCCPAICKKGDCKKGDRFIFQSKKVRIYLPSCSGVFQDSCHLVEGERSIRLAILRRLRPWAWPICTVARSWVG